MYLKRNDLVVVISGVHSGQQGRVLKVFRETAHVLVQGLRPATATSTRRWMVASPSPRPPFRDL